MPLHLLWKPPGIGSQEFLGQIKREWRLGGRGRSGIGHTGTLDPFAEGWLCVGSGEGTKLLAPLMKLPKRYRAEIVLGVTSDTLDGTGHIVESPSLDPRRLPPHLTEANLQAFLKSRLGRFEQIPPQFSALHVEGKRAYEWARMGVEKPLASRTCELLHAEMPSEGAVRLGKLPSGETVWIWTCTLEVSSGTYIRALARDWSQELVGAPGMLLSLVREGVGPWQGAASCSPWKLEKDDLKPLFSFINLSDLEAQKLRAHGQWPQHPHWGGVDRSRPVLAINPSGETFAWLSAQGERPERVFIQDPFFH